MILLACLPLLVASAGAPVTPPTAAERFPASLPGHVLLVVDVASGQIIRTDDPLAAGDELFPLGDALRPVLSIAALEDQVLDKAEVIRCDSRCWAGGGHGEPTHVSALAWSCETFFVELQRRLAPEVVGDWTIRSGFPAGEHDEEPEATVEQMTEFWRAAGRARLPIRESTLSELLAAAGISVRSPRGVARALDRPRHGARAIAGAAGTGAWVAGIWRASEERRWAFALYLRDGTTALATARCAHLLDETERVVRSSSRERGGDPWPLDE